MSAETDVLYSVSIDSDRNKWEYCNKIPKWIIRLNLVKLWTWYKNILIKNENSKKVLCGVVVRGNGHVWEFETFVEKRYIQEWQQDGIDIQPIYNTIPLKVNVRFMNVWVWLQDHRIVRKL